MRITGDLTVLPHIGGIADDICIIRSMQTEQINHDPAHTFMNTGTSISGRPSMGSWITYGLGNEADNLPAFVVLTSVGGGQAQPIAARQWHSGFLPSKYQGQFHAQGDPVLYLSNPGNMKRQRDVVDTVQALNQQYDAVTDDPEIQTRVSQYEMAFKMQTSVPELVDFSTEPQYIKEMYGTEGADGSFASNCLLARRMAERGVRFIQLYHRGWDHHGGIKDGIATTAKRVGQASAALVRALAQRGMLEATLVIWGRVRARRWRDPRDHHIRLFALMRRRGPGGISHGATDDFGYYAVQDVVHVHDFHATLLHLLGSSTRSSRSLPGRISPDGCAGHGIRSCSAAVARRRGPRGGEISNMRYMRTSSKRCAPACSCRRASCPPLRGAEAEASRRARAVHELQVTQIEQNAVVFHGSGP